MISCDLADERVKCAHWAAVAVPIFERHLKLHPDDENTKVSHAVLLLLSDRTDDAHRAALQLKVLRDGVSLYNAAYLFERLGDKKEALITLRKAIEAGFKNVTNLREFLTENKEGVLDLAGTPEYEEVKRMVDSITN